MTNGGNMTPIANIGDLVNVDGYADKLAEVISYTHEFRYEPDKIYEDIYYDCVCVDSAEYLLASNEDLTVVCQAQDSSDYLRIYHSKKDNDITSEILGEDLTEENFQREMERQWSKLIIESEGGTMIPKKTDKGRKKSPSIVRQERIDELLDEMLNVMAVAELVGSDDEYCRDRISEIEAELERLAKEGKR